MKLSRRLKTTLFLVAICGPTNAQGKIEQAETSLQTFDITKEPNPQDWRYFLRAQEALREQLWKKHKTMDKNLRDWHWGWRLGWVRACSSNKGKICLGILEEALLDKALVVRAEAATRLGALFSGSSNRHFFQLLTQAFKNPANFRSGKTLYIQERILYALHQIGDAKQREQAQKLAKSFATTHAYWKRLVASTETPNKRQLF